MTPRALSTRARRVLFGLGACWGAMVALVAGWAPSALGAALVAVAAFYGATRARGAPAAGQALGGRWHRQPDGSLICLDHPRLFIPDEPAAALHLAELHPDVWQALTRPGAVTPIRNRAERRAAVRHVRHHARR